MDAVAAKRLSAAIIIKAADDMKIVHEKTMILHSNCFKGGVCNTRELIGYLVALKKRDREIDLPFESQYDSTAIEFFKDNNKWGRTLLDLSDIDELPEKIKGMTAVLDDASKRCGGCITKYKGVATRRVRTESLT